MTDEELQAIRERESRATLGPWEDDGLSGIWHGADWLADVSMSYDSAFIAHARQDIPALLEEVVRLRAEVKHWSDAYHIEKDEYMRLNNDATEWRSQVETMRPIVETLLRDVLSEAPDVSDMTLQRIRIMLGSEVKE